MELSLALYRVFRVTLTLPPPFFVVTSSPARPQSNKEQMQLAFIKLMNNRFTHSQEYVEYCQIIIIIILMIENILSATVCQEHFTSMTKEYHQIVSFCIFCALYTETLKKTTEVPKLLMPTIVFTCRVLWNYLWATIIIYFAQKWFNISLLMTSKMILLWCCVDFIWKKLFTPKNDIISMF